jgi:putative endonuclease
MNPHQAITDASERMQAAFAAASATDVAGDNPNQGAARPPKKVLGGLGEDLAVEVLKGTGMKILDRNWRGQGGEIDIVAQEADGTLVVAEVKTRSGTGYGYPTVAVTQAKFARLRRLAAQWLAAHPIARSDVRIDVIGLIVSPEGVAMVIDHVKGAYR